jgi:hypothetical protein
MLIRWGKVFCTITLAGGLFFYGSTIADAEIAYEYAGDLGKFCNAENGSGLYGMCFSFVGGVLEIISNNQVYGLPVCVPRLTTVGKAADITKKWLTRHPEKNIEAASRAVVEALAEAFPCKK